MPVLRVDQRHYLWNGSGSVERQGYRGLDATPLGPADLRVGHRGVVAQLDPAGASRQRPDLFGLVPEGLGISVHVHPVAESATPCAHGRVQYAPIGLLLGGVDFANLFVVIKPGEIPGPYAALADAQAAGAVSINYGVFINSVISFLIVAWAVFMLIRGMNSMKKKEEEPAAVPTTKECGFCFSTIPIKAVRCPNCTSELKG